MFNSKFQTTFENKIPYINRTYQRTLNWMATGDGELTSRQARPDARDADLLAAAAAADAYASSSKAAGRFRRISNHGHRRDVHCSFMDLER
jgi:hypothetical protein